MAQGCLKFVRQVLNSFFHEAQVALNHSTASHSTCCQPHCPREPAPQSHSALEVSPSPTVGLHINAKLPEVHRALCGAVMVAQMFATAYLRLKDVGHSFTLT